MLLVAQALLPVRGFATQTLPPLLFFLHSQEWLFHIFFAALDHGQSSGFSTRPAVTGLRSI